MGCDVSEARKDDAAKPRVDLLPPEALLEVARVLGFGADKYGAENWRGVEAQRYYAAALRHLFAWKLGAPTDTESGLPHLAHAACSVLFMLAIEHQAEDK